MCEIDADPVRYVILGDSMQIAPALHSVVIVEGIEALSEARVLINCAADALEASLVDSGAYSTAFDYVSRWAGSFSAGARPAP